jgi:hypothetical protein
MVYVTSCGESVGLTSTSEMTWPAGRPVALAVKPVTPPVEVAVYLKVTSPLVKVLGL